MTLLITGGTGTLGRALVDAATAAGLAVRVASRRSGPRDASTTAEWAQMDLESGVGVASGLAGVDTVIHAASDPRRSKAVDVRGTQRLLDAARNAGIRHLVYVSIVGVDRIPLPYYRHKLAAEALVAAGAVPYSIIRITQFHELVDTMLRGIDRIPRLLLVPSGFEIQSVAAVEAAASVLRGLAAGPSVPRTDFSGPEVLTWKEVAALWLSARGAGKSVWNVPLPGRVAAALRRGYGTAPAAERGRLRWRDWVNHVYARDEKAEGAAE